MNRPPSPIPIRRFAHADTLLLDNLERLKPERPRDISLTPLIRTLDKAGPKARRQKAAEMIAQAESLLNTVEERLPRGKMAQARSREEVDIERALALLMAVRTHYPNDPAVQLLQSFGLGLMGEWERCFRLLDVLNHRTPDDPVVRLRTVWANRWSGRPEAALDLLRDHLLRHPDDAEALAQLRTLAKELGRQEIYFSFQRHLSPGDLGPLKEEVQYWLRNGEPSKAFAALEEPIATWRDRAPVLALLRTAAEDERHKELYFSTRLMQKDISPEELWADTRFWIEKRRPDWAEAALMLDLERSDDAAGRLRELRSPFRTAARNARQETLYYKLFRSGDWSDDVLYQEALFWIDVALGDSLQVANYLSRACQQLKQIGPDRASPNMGALALEVCRQSDPTGGVQFALEIAVREGSHGLWDVVLDDLLSLGFRTGWDTAIGLAERSMGSARSPAAHYTLGMLRVFQLRAYSDKVYNSYQSQLERLHDLGSANYLDMVGSLGRLTVGLASDNIATWIRLAKTARNELSSARDGGWPVPTALLFEGVALEPSSDEDTLPQPVIGLQSVAEDAELYLSQYIVCRAMAQHDQLSLRSDEDSHRHEREKVRIIRVIRTVTRYAMRMEQRRLLVHPRAIWTSNDPSLNRQLDRLRGLRTLSDDFERDWPGL